MKFLNKILFFLFFIISARNVAAQKSKNYFLFVGTYTSGKSEGIYVYNFNTDSGKTNYINSVKTSNPSYLAVAANKKFIYAVNENADSTRFTKTGSISAFSFNKKNGLLQQISKQESGGKHPCYVAIDKTGKWLVAANYSSGSFAILPIQKNGELAPAVQTIQHAGKGAIASRQDGPHAHSAFFSADNKTLYVQDLGIDKIMVYNFDATSGKAVAANIPFFETKSGSGPRHLDFHPSGKYMYVIEELTNTVNVLEKKMDGSLQSIQNIPSVPENYQGPAGGADIHVSTDGKFLYTSNRGTSNTIGIFSIDQKTGKINLLAHQSTMGSSPRNFSLDPTGNFLLVANQQSDNIVVFKRDSKTGLLIYTGHQINVANPVCLKWMAH